MWYFFVLRKEFSCNLFSNLLFVFLLMCSIILPYCLSIVESSRICGQKMENQYYTDGHNIIVENAKNGDEALFSEVEGIHIYWQDGVLVIDRLQDNPYMHQDTYTPDPLQTQLQSILRDNERLDLYLNCVEDWTFLPENHRFSVEIWRRVLLFSIGIQTISYYKAVFFIGKAAF